MASDLGNVQKMYGQDLGIAVTNAPAKVLLTETSRIMPNTILISSPQNEKIDTGDYSIFVTDYNGYPSQITHVVKIGDGLYMDEDKAIHLGIDKNTIKYDELTNQLYVDSSSLSKASSNNYGVIKISNLLSRENQLYPQISGISINSSGELYISDNFIDLLYNYIDNRINSAIAPLLESKTNIKLYDVISNMYYFPSDANEYSIQVIPNDIKEAVEENYIGIKNNIELSNKYIDSLSVNINIVSLSNVSLCKTDHFELNTTVINEQDINGIKFYDHIIKNLIIQFYPNLLNQNVEYNMIVQVQQQLNSEETNLISNNSFKLIQYSLSTNKNDLGFISNIYIEDNNDTDRNIISIIYFINDNILLYLRNHLIDSINLKLTYNNNIINLEFINDDFNINNIQIPNYNVLNNLVSWELSYKINNKEIAINSGLCEIIVNKINISNYYVTFANQVLYNNGMETAFYLDYSQLITGNNVPYISLISSFNYLNDPSKYIIDLTFTSNINISEINSKIKMYANALSLYELDTTNNIKMCNNDIDLNDLITFNENIYNINVSSNNISILSLLPSIKINIDEQIPIIFKDYIGYYNDDTLNSIINIIKNTYIIETNDNNKFTIRKTNASSINYYITYFNPETNNNIYINDTVNPDTSENYIGKTLQVFMECINTNNKIYYKCILDSNKQKNLNDLLTFNININYEEQNNNENIFVNNLDLSDENITIDDIINAGIDSSNIKTDITELCGLLFKEKNLISLLNCYELDLGTIFEIKFYKNNSNTKYYQTIELKQNFISFTKVINNITESIGQITCSNVNNKAYYFIGEINS